MDDLYVNLAKIGAQTKAKQEIEEGNQKFQSQPSPRNIEPILHTNPLLEGIIHPHQDVIDFQELFMRYPSFQ